MSLEAPLDDRVVDNAASVLWVLIQYNLKLASVDEVHIEYRVTLVVADLGWVDLNFKVPLSA